MDIGSKCYNEIEKLHETILKSLNKPNFILFLFFEHVYLKNKIK